MLLLLLFIRRRKENQNNTKPMGITINSIVIRLTVYCQGMIYLSWQKENRWKLSVKQLKTESEVKKT